MTKIVTDADGGEIPCHEDVDVALCRKTVEQGFGDLNPDNYLVGSVLVIREKRNSGCAKKDRLSLDSLSFLTGADVELCVTLNEQEKMCAWEWG